MEDEEALLRSPEAATTTNNGGGAKRNKKKRKPVKVKGKNKEIDNKRKNKIDRDDKLYNNFTLTVSVRRYKNGRGELDGERADGEHADGKRADGERADG